MDNNKEYTTADFPRLKIALLHYWFITWRGGEEVVRSILKLFPQAEIYTLFYDPKLIEREHITQRITASKLNNPFLRKHYQKIFPLYPYGVSSLKLSQNYDLIISSESGPIKGVEKPESTPHLCYIHTPMRYCWGFENDYLETIPSFLRYSVKYFFHQLKKWDVKTIANVDHFVANSKNVAARVEQFYQRKSSVCYPPIREDLFQKENITKREAAQKEYYLSFGAITPYKKIDLLVDTFNTNKKKLVIIGDGSEKKKLERRAGENIEFLGTLEWREISSLILSARALIFPGEEDFGMVPLEVMAHGVPVIAFEKGGALETVVMIPGQPEKSTGVFFPEQTVESLTGAIHTFEKQETHFVPETIQFHAKQFAEEKFLRHFSNEVLSLLNKKTGIKY